MPVAEPYRVVLISTYELGRQPFGVASPAAWLRREGCTVCCQDLFVQELDENAIVGADVVAFYLPMHTATRLALGVAQRVRALQPKAHLCFYGLYAPLNESLLREIGAVSILGGEFETGLVSLVRRLRAGNKSVGSEPSVSLERQQFLVPERSGLPPLERYARLYLGPDDSRTVGYTEASRGCKHTCRHCPIVPVYEGRFRIVQRGVVLEDIRQQIAVGAKHITFGDPDFLNGPSHSLAIVEALHREFPELTYDVTIKIQHLLRYRRHLPALRDTGCLFVTSAVESVDDRVLGFYRKNHTRADFVEAVRLCRKIGLRLNPTFVAFSPWITLEGYAELLQAVLELELVDDVAPVQYGIRLLIPQASLLLELPEIRERTGEFDGAALVYPWVHADPRVDRLQQSVMQTVQEGQREDRNRRQIFQRIWGLAREALHGSIGEDARIAALDSTRPAATVPYLTEPWYC